MTSKQSKKAEHEAFVSSMGATIGGVGVPSGASKSPWGSTFLVRKKFFEENSGQKDEEGPLESEELPPKLSVSV